jgi:hypothetical protein
MKKAQCETLYTFTDTKPRQEKWHIGFDVNLLDVYKTLSENDRERITELICQKPYNQSTLVPKIKNVIFNEPATIVLWQDGTKTVVKCGKLDTYSKEVGLVMAIAKKAMGNKSTAFNREINYWIENGRDDTVTWRDMNEYVSSPLDFIRGRSVRYRKGKETII